MRPTSLGLALVASVLGAGACAVPAAQDDRPTLVVTVFPIADLVARVAGEGIRVETLLPPRASPATWEATPGQVRALSRAAGYVAVGGGLDAWLDDFGAQRPYLSLTEGMALRDADPDHRHGAGTSTATGDPHVWLDPILVRDALLPSIVSFLGQLFPDRSADFETRAAVLADTLTALDTEIRTMLEGSRERGFVATHDAWAYFAARYDLQPLGSVYEHPGHEPSARGMAALIRSARVHDITVILAEPQLAESGARTLAEELGGTVRTVDPLGGPGLAGRESYAAMMRTNAAEFALALGAR